MILKSDASRGVCVMILGAGVLTMNDAVSKYLVESYPIGQILCLRQIVALTAILVFVWKTDKWRDLRINNGTAHAIRAVMHVGGAALIVWALSALPIATVTAIVFSSPIVVLMFSLRLLGEHVSRRRWLAVIIGFSGVLAIIRPVGVDFQWALLIPVAAAVTSGMRDLLTRRLARTDTSISVLFWASVLLIVASAFTLPLGWRPLTPDATIWLLVNGLLNAGAHFLMIEALRLGAAGLVSPFRYTAILWATIAGFLIWQELPDPMTLIGAGLLVVSGVLIIRRENTGWTATTGT
jgi:drug/metabolite transporter (DMT)-like permease